MAGNELQRYYDHNTDLFLRIGSSGPGHAIHRGLWGPGVRDGREAAEYVNDLIARRIRGCLPREPRAVLDLGCGVGGTLFSLARTFSDTRLHGVTISARQVSIARELAQGKALGERCTFVQADFEDLDLDLDLRADAIIAVESFIHSSRPERLLATCRRHLVEDGVLVIVDDFLTRPVPPEDPALRETIDTFRTGWRVPGLCTLTDLDALARRAGLEPLETRDLSGLIRTGRPRDWLVSMASPLARALGLTRRPFWANVVGGNALNTALRSGWIQYRLLALRPPVPDGPP
jgi:SAM-dependent methyltransferase